MADVSKRFAKGIMENTAATPPVYVVPLGKKAFVKAITICNTSSTDYKFYISLAGAYVVYAHTIKAFDTITIPFIDQIVESGEEIKVFKENSTAATIYYYISGREVDVE